MTVLRRVACLLMAAFAWGVCVVSSAAAATDQPTPSTPVQLPAGASASHGRFLLLVGVAVLAALCVWLLRRRGDGEEDGPPGASGVDGTGGS